ncbi:MAG: type III ribulose-bisphosphate carboxylase [Nitrosopumilus sp.]|nr:type III ribulose-bisphosphate carboxylase [Nitrosopumilus sp.]
MKSKNQYLNFVDYGYSPKKSDVVCLFRFEPKNGISIRESVGRLASESSTGTWTALSKMPTRVKKLQAISFDVKDDFVKIAYPIDLWEKENVPQFLSGIAGNIFGMKAIKNLRLVDISIPSEFLSNFRGPEFGICGIRKLLRVKKRPITGAVIKPKIGWSALEHSQIGYETWMGGFDLIKDDENLTSTKFNKFEDRVKIASKMRDRAEKETGERKSALFNITAETRLMEKRAKLLHELGWEFAMIDVITVGISALQTMRETCHDFGLAIHAHRAMHAVFDRNPKHGISMMVLAKIMRMIGVDQIHIGTIVGKMSGSKTDVTSIKNQITEKRIKGNLQNFLLDQNWNFIKPVLPIASGGLHPGLIPSVIGTLGTDIGILVSGGVHGHPDGTRSGAIACMQSIEATMQNIPVKEYAKSHGELHLALEKWSNIKSNG